MILDKIKKPNDIHKIPLAEFPQLAEEIRSFLIESVSRTGGHLASNLGVVELTLALHNVLDFPDDKLIWDVGHQAYTHKILTGRKGEFETLRKEGGLSGFPKRGESNCDSFDAGHSSDSISAGLGYVHARDLLGENYHVVSVIGDGALTGGMAYEALNNAAELDTNFIIVLNDNNMSISPNVGGMSNYLSAIRTAEAYTGMKMSLNKAVKKIPRVGTAMVDAVRRTKSSIKQLFIPGMLFENMGITYLGPVDGHDIGKLQDILNKAKKVLVCGKGSSGLAAKEMEIRFMRIGVDVDSITDTDLMRMRAVFQDEDSLVFGFSIGGQKEEIIFLLKEAKKRGAKTILFTANNRDDYKEFCTEVVLVPSLLHLNHGNVISPQFPILIMTDIIYSYYVERDETKKKILHERTLQALEKSYVEKIERK